MAKTYVNFCHSISWQYGQNYLFKLGLWNFDWQSLGYYELYLALNMALVLIYTPTWCDWAIPAYAVMIKEIILPGS